MKGEGVKFLLVDDDEVDVMAVRRAFDAARVPCSLIVASDGLEAFDKLRGRNGTPALTRPYIVLLDLNMPRMNGIEFLRELRADPEHRNAVVFVLTTSREKAHKEEAYGFNVAGYIVKSEATEDFVEMARMLDLFRRLVALP